MASGADGGVTGHSWSLAIEEQFYLVWPPIFAIALIGRRRLAIGVLIVTLAALLLAYRIALPLPSDRPDPWVEFATLPQAPSILTGVLLALMMRGVPRISFLMVAAAVGLIFAMAGWSDFAFGERFGYELIALASVVLILAALRGWFTLGPLVGLGRISYGVYVWHLPIVVWLGVNKGQASLAMDIAAVALVIAVAAASHRWLERPFLSLKARLSAAPTETPRLLRREV